MFSDGDLAPLRDYPREYGQTELRDLSTAVGLLTPLGA